MHVKFNLIIFIVIIIYSAGVFIMVAIGIGIGFVILLIEIGYSKYENMKEKQNNIAKKAVARWKRYVQVRLFQHQSFFCMSSNMHIRKPVGFCFPASMRLLLLPADGFKSTNRYTVLSSFLKLLSGSLTD